METLLVLMMVIAAAAYAAQSLLPQAWLPRRLRRVKSAADGCSSCEPATDPRRLREHETVTGEACELKPAGDRTRAFLDSLP